MQREKYPRKRNKAGHKRAFTATEEEVIVETLLHYADRGVVLSHTNLSEAVNTFIELLPAARQAQLPFRDGRPEEGMVTCI